MWSRAMPRLSFQSGIARLDTEPRGQGDCAKIEVMTLREQVEQYNKSLKRFNEWEEQERRLERPPAAIIADIGAIADWIPRATRLADPDPQKLGIQRMFKALSLISPRAISR